MHMIILLLSLNCWSANTILSYRCNNPYAVRRGINEWKTEMHLKNKESNELQKGMKILPALSSRENATHKGGC